MSQIGLFSDPEVMKVFILETKEHLDVIEPNLLKLEKEPENPEVINDIFRSMHSIKGASSFLGFCKMTDVSHKLESVLDKLRKGKANTSPEIIDLILEGKDVIGELLSDLEAGGDRATSTQTLPIEEKILRVNESLSQPQTTVSSVKVEAKSTTENLEIDAFVTASRQYLNLMQDCLEQMHRGQVTKNFLDNYLRAIQSLRNSASYMQLKGIENLMEKKGELLEKFQAGEVELSQKMVDLLSRTYEAVKSEIDNMGKGLPPSDFTSLINLLTQTILEDSDHQRLGEILVSMGKVAEDDVQKALDDQKPIGEILIGQNKIGQQDLDQALQKQNELKVEKGVKVEHTVRVEESRLDHLMNLIGELIINRNRFILIDRKMRSDEQEVKIKEELKQATTMLSEISNNLQATIMKVRMLPINSVFQKFPRMVRDLSREKGKKVSLKIFGGKTEVDKTIIERIGDPLVHLIRNALDHGIEVPSERSKYDKPDEGTVTIRAFHEGHNVVIEVEDDGRGMDAEVLKSKAMEKGMLTATQAEKMENDDAYDIIFAPGFSTVSCVTDISGRGVGMDVVKRNIQSLNGQIITSTRLGQGTKFSLRLPLTLAVIEALLIETGGMIFALPLTAVKETLSVSREQIKTIAKKKVIVVREKTLKLVELSCLLNLAASHKEKNDVPVVIIGEGERELGIMVDAIREKEEVVIKPLEKLLANTQGFSGATILGSGDVILILNPLDLLKL